MLYEQYGLLDYDSESKTHALNHYYDGYGWFECAFAQDVIDELEFNPFDITKNTVNILSLQWIRIVRQSV